ncbi:MAG: hypothetical protein Kow0077_09790 [Anaerolineae bacterium]
MTWWRQFKDAWANLPAHLRRVVFALLGLAVVLMILAFVLPPEFQLWPALGLFAVFILAQGLILMQLWGERAVVRRARRQFLRGDFVQVVALLEEEYRAGRNDAMSDTLLGNAYRQLGELQASQQALARAVEREPDNPFALYGLGRTLLAAGEYAQAAAQIAAAIEHGAQPAVSVELALAHYLCGDSEDTARALHAADALDLEPHRALMAALLRVRLGDHTSQDVHSRKEAGLRYWEAEAERFASTPYGRALQAQLDDFRAGLPA